MFKRDALNHNIEYDLLFAWATGKSTMHVLNNTFIYDCRIDVTQVPHFEKITTYVEADDQTGFCAVSFGFCKIMSGDYYFYCVKKRFFLSSFSLFRPVLYLCLMAYVSR